MINRHFVPRIPLHSIVAALALAALSSCGNKPETELVIYAYDSFASEWGTGPAVIPAFEKATGIKVELVAAGDAGQTLARVVAEKASPRADVVLGVDNNLAPKAIAAGVLEPFRPRRASEVPESLVLDREWRLTPFDYGTFAIIWDSEKLQNPPASLEDLAKPEFAGKLILMDPRTSTPGLGFLAWTDSVYGDALADYWKRLKPSILAMTPGWDSGYGLFTKGEAPLVISYTTSPAYHAEYETAGRYRALEFPEGHPRQVEGLGVVKGARHPAAARLFVDFALSDEFQKAIPLTNWMYPVIQATELPKSFDHAPKPRKEITPDPARLDSAEKAALGSL